MFYVRGLTLAILLPLYVTVPVIMAEFFPNVVDGELHGLWSWASALVVGLATGVLAVVIVVLPFMLFNSTSNEVDEFFNLSSLILCWGAILCALVCLYLYTLYTSRFVIWPSTFRHRFVFDLLVQAGFFLPVFFVMAVLIRLVMNRLRSRTQRLHTRGAIIAELLDIVYEIEKPEYESSWTEFWHRTWMTSRLEAVATCIESYFPRYYLTGVPEMDRWTDRCASEMANGVREVIKSVVASNAHTTADLKARITRYLTAALMSEWGRYDRVSSEKLSRKQGFKDRAKSTATALLTAAVPVLLLLMLRRLGVVVAEPLLTYLTVGCYIWAALSLLSRLDPQYAVKLGALKDLTKMLPGRKDGGDG